MTPILDDAATRHLTAPAADPRTHVGTNTPSRHGNTHRTHEPRDHHRHADHKTDHGDDE